MMSARITSNMPHMSAAVCRAMTVPFVRQRITARIQITLNTRSAISRVNGALSLPARRTRKTVLRAVSPQCSSAGQLQYQTPFQTPADMSGVQKMLASLSETVAKLGAVLLLGIAAAVAAFAGGQLPGSAKVVGRIVGGILGAAVGGFLITKLKAERTQAAVTQLWVLLAAKEDPSTLTATEVEQLGKRLGVNLASERVEDLKTMYGVFVESMIPTGEAALNGREADAIRDFKVALGLTDEEAAPVHLDVGRRLTRQGAEAGSREGSLLEKKTFQKLIFVSNLVFGDQKSAFLLPWRRVFGLSDAQLSVAKRESAKALFKAFLDARGGKLQADRQQLAELKQYQQRVRLSDDVATEMVKEAARANIEADLDLAVECIKSRTQKRDVSDAMNAVSRILAFNRQMAALAGDAELVAGVGRSNVFGGKYDSDSGEGKTRELRDLIKVYIEERLRLDGAVTESLEADLHELQSTLGLGPKEVAGIRNEVASVAYKRLLRDEFRSGRLEAATSKAAALEELCDRLKFEPDAAAAIHKALFTERIESFLEDNQLTDAEAEELITLRKLLCIGSKDFQEIEVASKGRVFTAAVVDALGAGIDSFSTEDRTNVKKAREAVRLDEKLAKKILADTARKAFMGFITRSRNTRNKVDGAKELKKLVYFSSIVVSPLLEDLKTKEEREAEAAVVQAGKDAAAKQKADAATREAAKKELAELMAAAKEAADAEVAAEKAAADIGSPQSKTATSAEEVSSSETVAEAESAPEVEVVAEAESVEEVQPASLSKAQTAAAERAAGEEVGETGVVMKSQKEVTLKDDLELRDRLDIYRNFLLYCMSGDVVILPMGSTVVVERDSSEFARLSQLGDVLGLNPMEVNSVHSGLAEQSFRHQVQTVMGDGLLNKERSEALTEMRLKMGLSEEAATKIIKGVQNQRLIGNLQAAKSQGALTLEKVLDMADSGVDVDSFISADMRLQMFSKEVAKQLSSGTGEFDEVNLLEVLPEKLQLSKAKVTSTIEGLAKDRKRTTLVQAISFLRQKKLDEVAKSLNNLVACQKVLPSEVPASWDQRAELQDLFSTYLTRETDTGKRNRVQMVLGISDSEVESLQGLVETGQFKLVQEADAESFF